jgi:uncharacterized protein (TIGR02996 family)
MTDDAALFAAALTHPREDTPRLVLADWFDENGEPELGDAMRTMPEVVPFLAELLPWDRPPTRWGWKSRDEATPDFRDVLAVARLLVRYRDRFPTPPNAPERFDPDAKPARSFQPVPGPLDFLARWQSARQRQITDLRARVARDAATWRPQQRKFVSVTPDPELFEYRSCLVHELLLRGHDPHTAAGARWHLTAMRDRGHPLAWLPTRLLPVESAVAASVPQVGPGGRGWTATAPANADGDPLPSGGTPGAVTIQIEEALPESPAGAAVREWETQSNGRTRAAVVRLDPPVTSGGLREDWVRSLPFEPLAGGGDFRWVSAAHALGVLFSAAQNGGAYTRGEAGAYGRLHAWQSFGWLAGTAAGATADEIAGVAERCAWVRFDGDWFDHIAWDLGLIALRPDGRSLAVLAAADTD